MIAERVLKEASRKGQKRVRYLGDNAEEISEKEREEEQKEKLQEQNNEDAQITDEQREALSRREKGKARKLRHSTGISQST